MRINNELHWRWCVECLYLTATVAGCLRSVDAAIFTLQLLFLEVRALDV